MGLQNINEADRDDNIRVRNRGKVGSSLEFIYGGATEDRYTANNQRISISSNVKFDAIPVPIPEH